MSARLDGGVALVTGASRGDPNLERRSGTVVVAAQLARDCAAGA